MEKDESLEAIRGFASIYVVLSHWVLSVPHVNIALKLIFSFGQEAVIVFFILSGYVIQLSWEASKDNTFKTYFIKRFRRIYFPFLISILLSLLISPRVFKGSELLGNLLMLQDFETGKPGTIVRTFMGNSPLWSLSYEWWFYMLFPLLSRFIQPKKYRAFYIGTVSASSLCLYVLFPNHLLLIPLYFLIWWLGVELAYIKKRGMSLNWVSIKNPATMVFLIVVLLGIVCLWHSQSHKNLQMGIYPLLFFRHFLFALIAVLFVTFFPLVKRKLVQLISTFKIASPISYSLYIFHYIILVQLDTFLPWIIEIPLKLSFLFFLCYLVELKGQPIVNKLIR